MKSSVPSVEPWSTTTRSRSRTESRQCSSHGSPFHVTTTTATSGTSGGAIGNRSPSNDALPQEHDDAGQREEDRHHEEQEAAREGEIRMDAQLAEEADEERLTHADAVDREGHEHDQEQERLENHVGQHREVDAD